ncbi:MAG TPA: toprim domain-containing protein [Sphingomicrobium sp.]|nr:toprim domain-containing protein [Sphingomicrobium sp.]
MLRALEAERLIEPNAAGAAQPPSERGGARRNAAALRLWEEARSIAGTPAAAYLASRGLAANPAQLRYHPRTPHGPAPLTEFRPALIAAVRDESGLVAVHRTFIDRTGSGLADLAGPRCGLGRFGRGAVRLGGRASRLGLAEGIETALSATALFGVPCWATLGTERFRRIALPPEVSELLLFLDHDPGGRRAERLAREAFAHVPLIEVHVPERPGEDWNDVLRRDAGSAATPRPLLRA